MYGEPVGFPLFCSILFYMNFFTNSISAIRQKPDDYKNNPKLQLVFLGFLTRIPLFFKYLKLGAGHDLNVRPSGYEPDELPGKVLIS